MRKARRIHNLASIYQILKHDQALIIKIIKMENLFCIIKWDCGSTYMYIYRVITLTPKVKNVRIKNEYTVCRM